jgi:hypothetical protein
MPLHLCAIMRDLRKIPHASPPQRYWSNVIVITFYSDVECCLAIILRVTESYMLLRQISHRHVINLTMGS